MGISRAFKALLNYPEPKLGEVLSGASWPCRFVKIGPDRGRIIFVDRSTSERWGQSVDRKAIKALAITELFYKLRRENKKLELSPECISGIIDCYESFSQQLI